MLNKVFIFSAAVLMLSACMTLPDAPDASLPPPDRHGVTEFTLSNGMKIIVKEDHRSPVLVTQFWYKVGASDEPNGLTGISHVLEHMMFKGTSKYPAETFTEIVKQKGGRYNAFTGPDYTAYYEVFEKSHLALSFDLESDRMVNLILREEDFAKEIEVVKEERRMRTDDDPRARVWEQLYATAFRNAPYGNPVIGWMDDLDHLTLKELQKWYQTWYSPNNAFVVVAGDVNPDEVYALALKYLAPLQPRALPNRKPRREIQQAGERRFTLEAPAKKPFLTIAYKVPNIKTSPTEWEPYALVVLAGILSGSSSARFQKNLIRGRKIALGVGTNYDPYSLYDDLFVITGTPLADVSIAQLEQAIEEEVNRVKTEGIEEKELDFIKANLTANEVYSQDSITRQAYKLGQYEAIGVGWRTLYEKTDRIRNITPDQVQAVARKYLSKQVKTVGQLAPQPISLNDSDIQ